MHDSVEDRVRAEGRDADAIHHRHPTLALNACARGTRAARRVTPDTEGTNAAVGDVERGVPLPEIGAPVCATRSASRKTGPLQAAGVHLLTRLDLALQAPKHRTPEES